MKVLQQNKVKLLIRWQEQNKSNMNLLSIELFFFNEKIFQSENLTTNCDDRENAN